MATDHDIRLIERATRAREKAEREWREAIASANHEGQTLRAIGRAAGISHVRVLQICREMNAGGFRT